MKLRVLGCSGGIAAGLHTTSLLLDGDILLDAGTGVGELSLPELRRLRHIFLTHSHLDHIAGLPLLVDTLFGLSDAPLTIHALPETIEVLKTHIFNWKVWPDFAELPSRAESTMRYRPMQVGESVTVDGRTITMLPAVHTVPAAGYSIVTPEHAIAFSGDTSENDVLWEALNRLPRLDLLLVECAFADADRDLADLARHYCPERLGRDLAKLTHRPRILITHLKPAYEDRIMAECRAAAPDRDLHRLRDGDSLAF